jgi:hypothetical protein
MAVGEEWARLGMKLSLHNRLCGKVQSSARRCDQTAHDRAGRSDEHNQPHHETTPRYVHQDMLGLAT